MQNYNEKSKIQPLAVVPLWGRLIATVCSTLVEKPLQISTFYAKQSQLPKNENELN